MPVLHFIIALVLIAPALTRLDPPESHALRPGENQSANRQGRQPHHFPESWRALTALLTPPGKDLGSTNNDH
jgi:hypothetical protein